MVSGIFTPDLCQVLYLLALWVAVRDHLVEYIPFSLCTITWWRSSCSLLCWPTTTTYFVLAHPFSSIRYAQCCTSCILLLSTISQPTNWAALADMQPLRLHVPFLVAVSISFFFIFTLGYYLLDSDTSVIFRIGIFQGSNSRSNLLGATVQKLVPCYGARGSLLYDNPDDKLNAVHLDTRDLNQSLLT